MSVSHPLAAASLIAGLLLTGCAHTQQSQPIMVYKYDGSLQCEGGGKSVQTMRRELEQAGVEVVCAQKARDGRVYPAMCGAATGRINVYTIDESDLDTAEALGFKSVETLPAAGIPSCE